MAKRHFLYLSALFFIGCATVSERSSESTPPSSRTAEVHKPVTSSTREANRDKPKPHHKEAPALVVIDHGDFEIHYDPNMRSAKYVKYTALAQNLRSKAAQRRDKFVADPLVVNQGLPYVSPKEYVHSGYDKGHLAPSADFGFSQRSNDLTFVMSNMSPQTPQLNRKAWKYLEQQVRKWICGEERVMVITGPIFDEHPKTLKSGLPIPVQYFKIVVDETPPQKVIGFIYNQTDSTNVIHERVSTVFEIEQKTHLDLEAELPEDVRTRVRAPSSFESWKEADCG